MEKSFRDAVSKGCAVGAFLKLENRKPTFDISCKVISYFIFLQKGKKILSQIFFLILVKRFKFNLNEKHMCVFYRTMLSPLGQNKSLAILPSSFVLKIKQIPHLYHPSFIPKPLV